MMGGQSLDEQMSSACQLIRSQQEDKSEQLLSSLTHWDYDVDHTDEMNQTLLHFAAQVLCVHGRAHDGEMEACGW